MVTKKKPSKSTAKKTVKKVATKRASPKKVTQMKSFRLYKEEKPFIRAAVTRQTVYWLILLVFILITQLWILKIQMDIANLTTLVSNQ